MENRYTVRTYLMFSLGLLAAVFRADGAAVENDPVFPGKTWESVPPETLGMNREKLEAARTYALSAEGAGYIARHGKLVMAWGPVEKTYDLKSTSKSIGMTAVGLALMDGKLNLEDKAIRYQPDLGIDSEHPEVSAANRATGWLGEITLEHLATQTAGFDKPGGYTKLLFQPGTRWFYSDGGPNWLAECVTLAYGVDIETLLFDRVFTEIGIRRGVDLRWRKHAYRSKELHGIRRCEFGSGVHANVDAMARIGYLYLRRGTWKGKQLLPASFVDRATQPVDWVRPLPEHGDAKHGNASSHYGLLWWNNGDGTLANVPRDAYWSWGLYDSLIFVVPSLDIVAARRRIALCGVAPVLRADCVGRGKW